MRDLILVILTLISVVVVSKIILKKVNPIFVFLASGVIILIIASAINGKSPLGKGSIGNIFFDAFGYVTKSFNSTVSGVGAIIMSVTGYAAYMNHIKASEKMAFLATKPLSRIRNPYLVLAGIYVIGILMKLVITSQSGIAMLLLPTVFPIFMALGINSLTAASVLCLVCLDWGPNDGSTIFAASVLKMNVVKMFMNYQVIIAASIIVVTAILIPIYYKHMDKKDIERGILKADEEKKEVTNPDCPNYYAFLPLVPLIIVFVCAFIPKVKMDVVTANFIGVAAVFVIEFIRRKDRKDVPKDIVVVLKGMGNIFVSVVCIIIAASVFAEGINQLGGIAILVKLIANVKGANLITILLMTLITFGAALIMGSGAASLYAFGPLVPSIALNLGVNPIVMVLPMELSAALGRGLSPVAGATNAIAGYAKQNTMEVVKRTALPILLGLAVNIAVSCIIL